MCFNTPLKASNSLKSPHIQRHLGSAGGKGRTDEPAESRVSRPAECWRGGQRQGVRPPLSGPPFPVPPAAGRR